MTILEICPACGDGYLENRLIDGRAIVNRKVVGFTTTYAACPVCESEVMDYDDIAHCTNECMIIKTFIDKELRGYTSK